MKTIYLESLDSTQTYLKKLVSQKKVKLPLAIVANTQKKGIGSRNNSWISLDGNLFLSFAIPLNLLPLDLKLESSSIYFAYLLKETLVELGSSVWLKWPNDFYINNVKIGGMITNIIGDTLICGVGINLVNAPKKFKKLDINIAKELVLNNYFKKIENILSWKRIFSIYKVEFQRNKNFYIHNDNLRVSLENAILQEDGSIIINDKRIYSTR